METPEFLLAPMDGMTRASFRSICFDYGADGATTEMIQSLAYGRAKRRLSLPDHRLSPHSQSHSLSH